MPFLSTTYADLGSVFDEQENIIASFRHYPNEQLLYISWSGNLTGPEVIKVATAALKLEKQYHFPLLLNDKTHATGEWADALPWLEYEWLPAAVEEGLRAFAYVFSPDLASHLISAEFSEKIGQHMPVHLFYDVPSASQWLQQQFEAA
ncbi:hypothetical protein [Hymenobacter sp. DG25A]|uniref:hypothetical protein n=1 Tax=Hymenobacter sp. DG25A TaxID=1385663 RepID=UPI0006BD86B6|nr:hypothetical protein [Hymenobacter sp. DG25A]ALD21476.1 hypothetical protein AM218_09935 [Hymenobacter sp. DG25A]